MTENKYPPVRLDEETYKTIKSNAQRSGRKIGAEIRQMLAIVTAPEKGTETVIGVARVTRKDGVISIDDAEGKELIAIGRHITHEPAHAPTEVFPANYGETKGTFADTANQFQSVEEKEG